MTQSEEKLDTVQSLAKFLQVSTACIRKHTRTTNIPFLRIGRVVRFDRQSVLTWFQKQNESLREA